MKALHTGARRYCWDSIARAYAAQVPPQRQDLVDLLGDPFRFCSGVRLLYAYEDQLRRDTGRTLMTLAEPAAGGDERNSGLLPGVGILILESVLDEVERFTPDDFSTVGEARTALAEAARRARPMLGWSLEVMPNGERVRRELTPDWDEETRALAEDVRRGFIDFVLTATPEEAAGLGPMPYRRVLSDAQVRRLRAACQRRWGADPTRGHWYPLTEVDDPSGLLVVNAYAFSQEIDSDGVREILRRRGVARVWEMTERWPQDPAREMDLSACCFAAIEAMWSSREMNWLMYVSHEGTVTFSGDWLVPAIKFRWPTWRDAVYGPFVPRAPDV